MQALNSDVRFFAEDRPALAVGASSLYFSIPPEPRSAALVLVESTVQGRGTGASVFEVGRGRRRMGEPGKGGPLEAGSLKSKRPPLAVYIRVLSFTTRFLEPFSEGFFESEPRLLRR